MKHPLLLSMVVLCGTGFFHSCTTDKTPVPATIDTSCTHDGQDIMSYQNDIVPIMTTYCTDPSFGDCHQAGGSLAPDFTSYDNLAFEAGTGILEDRISDNPQTGSKMPLSTTTGPTELSPCDMEKLLLWIDQGYPNN